MSDRKLPLFQRLFFPHLALLLAVILVTSWLGGRMIRDLSLQGVSRNLRTHAELIRFQLPSDMSAANVHVIDSTCGVLGDAADIRVTVILRSGEVIGDSDEDPGGMDDHATRPEILAAWSGEIGVSERFSKTLGVTMHYAAIPVYRGGELVAAVRTAVPAMDVERALGSVYRKLSIAALVLALIAALITYLLARRVSVPLVEMKAGAERFARGELQTRLHDPAIGELSALSDAMNDMAAQLDSRIRTMTRQREEQEAVLAGMTEGVLAVDLEERVIIVNRALGELFAVDPRRAKGRYLQEVIRKTEVHQFVRDLPGPGDSTSDLELAFGDRILQAHGAVMRDASGKRSGAVIVFRDITRLRALEKTRRDFIANVSHELKTPITSIKGYVETLLDGSVSDAEQTTRFLTIIGNRADQLAEMIDDLLDLARIERETEEGSVDREECLVGDLVAEAVGLCEQSASVRGQRIRVDGSEELSVRVNRRSFPQAIINLIDNAVKYGPDGSTITVSASAEGETVVIRVADEGPGIARKHHDRLFERFYRVDTSRSRDSGGTGLGLAIVKHIALAHSGTVAVDSEPGRGSTFEIRLPRANV